jgi:adenylosuccinate synthase
VTSSNTIAGGACTGTGFGPLSSTAWPASLKPIQTRVGEGPIPHLDGTQIEEKCRRIGQEFGATTGRKRLCGWFDAMLVRHAVRVNGLNTLIVTKLDVLDEFD